MRGDHRSASLKCSATSDFRNSHAPRPVQPRLRPLLRSRLLWMCWRWRPPQAPRQSFFIGLFDKLLETKQTNTFVSLSGSLLGSSLEPCLTSTRFVIYLNHLWWPGLDSSPTFSHAGSRRILLSWEILLISHFGTHFRLGSVSSFKALPLYIQNKNR